MENVLTSSVIGSGYLLNQKNNRNTEKNDNMFTQPNNQFVYSSNIHKEVTNYEHNLAERNFKNAKNAIITNTIPSQFNNKIINKNNNPKEILHSDLSGKNIEFKHNNMIPFFGSKVRQNTNNINDSTLSNHTGIEHFVTSKKETEPAFNPTFNSNINYGTQNQNETVQSRVNSSTYKRNELPFDQVKVGPGLNNGYNAEPVGGFHPETRPYIMPKSIDELRPKSNPKVTYKGRMIPGKEINNKPGKMGKMLQYNPPQVFEQGPEKYWVYVKWMTL